MNKIWNVLFHKSTQRLPQAIRPLVPTPDLFMETTKLLREINKGTVEVSQTKMTVDDPQASVKAGLPQIDVEASISRNKQMAETLSIRVVKQ